MDTQYVKAAMDEQGYVDFGALPPHEQSRIMCRAQDLKRLEQEERDRRCERLFHSGC